MKIVLLLDVCSSSTLLERLKLTDSLDILQNFYESLSKWILNSRYIKKIELYKFIGDGFIFIIEDLIDNVLLFCNELVVFANMRIDNLQKHLEIQDLPRKGITIGIDVGELFVININNKLEYLSRSINIASRLQGLLKDPLDVNKIAISSNAYSRIENTDIKKNCSKRIDKLHNINNDSKMNYYVYFSDLSYAKINSRQNLKTIYFNNSKVNEFKFKIQDSSGTVVYISKGHPSLNDAFNASEVFNTDPNTV